MDLQLIKKTLAQAPVFRKAVVAVSGGADSVALAFILRKLGHKIVVAHVNHGLRGAESDADEDLVRSLAKQWRAPFESTRLNPGSLKRGNLENRMRQLRYAFLEEVRAKHKADVIAVAHHRDDQVETVLMHLMRGSGLRGAAGMPKSKDKIVRPLLDIPKKDLVELLEKEGIPYRTDLSNHDLAFKRNLVRHVVLPTLKQDWATAEHDLITLSDFAREQIGSIEAKAKQWIQRHVQNDRFNRTTFLKLPDTLQSEILLMLAGHYDVYRKPLAELSKLVHDGTTGKRKRLGGRWFRILYNQVHFYSNLVDRHPSCVPQPLKGKIQWGRWLITGLKTKGLFVRCWKPGDRFQPSGMDGTKKLQNLFVDLKIPKEDRHGIPIIVDEKDRILGVGNLRVARNAGFLKKQVTITPID